MTTDKTLTRRRLPDERPSTTRGFRLTYLHKDGSSDIMHLYFTVSTYEDGTPGEIFVKADKTGTLASGALDAVAVMASLMLQYGIPLSEVVAKLRHTRYPPAGFTGDPEFPSCTSPLDLLAQWLTKRFP